MLQAISRVNLREFAGRHMKTPQVHQALQGLLSVDEIKTLRQFLSSQKRDQGEDDLAIAESASDFMDMDDLIDAIQFKQQMDDRNHQQSFGGNLGTSAAELESLQRKIGRILREKEDDAEFFSSKIRQLKRQLKEANLEKGELEEQVERLQQNKQRLEKFYKDKMGISVNGN